jgi:hypothetical protein
MIECFHILSLSSEFPVPGFQLLLTGNRQL